MPLPYGSWPSPFLASTLAASVPRIDGARFVGQDIWWGESVPSEGGRVTVRSRQGEVLPRPWSARSRVHEYGGGSWTVDESGTLFFVEAKDQRVYALRSGDEPMPLTPAGPRHGGLRWQQGRLFAVRENLDAEPHERGIVEIPLDGSAAEDGSAVRIHVSGTGFFAHPTLSPDGGHVAWVQWDESQMPWEKAQVGISDGSVIPASAALQPEWISPDSLLFLDDPSGRWNLYRLQLGEAATAVAPANADTGGGLWVLGNRWYQRLDDGRILAVRTNGADHLVLIDGDDVRTLPFPADGELSIEAVAGERALISGSGSHVARGLWLLDLESGAAWSIRGGETVDPAWQPAPRPLTAQSAHGPVHAFFYPPTNPEAEAPADALPPAVVFVHSGPTAHVSGAASGAIAFFTSRGIGVLDVNYGGSTGYGREYRERLQGNWGVVDVDDVLAATHELCAQGLADPQRLAIRGGSAGGWTVLSALVRGGVFSAGISRYGVADLRMLAADTHDFERHYLDGLVGPLPEAEAVYIERSPLTHADRFDVPVLLLQGEDDRVVPPAQSEAIRDALAARGIEHEYVLYAGEGHSFRRAETLIDALERELRFLGRVFGFTPQL